MINATLGHFARNRPCYNSTSPLVASRIESFPITTAHRPQIAKLDIINVHLNGVADSSTEYIAGPFAADALEEGHGLESFTRDEDYVV